jgi:selenocysteine lyase/cysteine desulfurase
MDLTRRNILAGLATLTTAVGVTGGSATLKAQQNPGGTVFARGELMPGLAPGYLNNASHHPVMSGAASAIAGYANNLVTGHAAGNSQAVRSKFARLINANADEVVYAPSTSMGEYLVTMALNLPRKGGRIVTDALHFIGSFYLYEQLAKQGMEVVILPVLEDGSVSISQYAEAITADTRLVAVSHVSWVNGFQHDLKALSDLAHAQGAYLFADIIQSAGNTPIDVKAMGVDFACSGTYKWLMGDFGLAFLYADSRLVEELTPPWYGYLQTRNFVTPLTHLYPFDEPGSPAYTSVPASGVGGIFNGSFPPRMIEAGVEVSLDWLLETGVETLQAHRLPMIRALQTTLRERGHRPYTPEGSTSSLVSFILKDATVLDEKLQRAGISIATYGDRFRISPSFFNDMNDIDRVIDVIGRA